MSVKMLNTCLLKKCLRNTLTTLKKLNNSIDDLQTGKKIVDSIFLKSILWYICRLELTNSGNVQLEFNWVSEETAKAVSFAMPDNQGKHNVKKHPGFELSPQLVGEPFSWRSEHCSICSLSSQGEAEQVFHGVCRAKQVWETQELTSVLPEPGTLALH